MRTFLLLIFSALIMTSCENKEIAKGRNLYEMYFELVLRDPQSFTVYNEQFNIEDKVKVEWKLEYGARNGFGGMVRETVEFTTIDKMLFISGCCYELKDKELIKVY